MCEHMGEARISMQNIQEKNMQNMQEYLKKQARNSQTGAHDMRTQWEPCENSAGTLKDSQEPVQIAKFHPSACTQIRAIETARRTDLRGRWHTQRWPNPHPETRILGWMRYTVRPTPWRLLRPTANRMGLKRKGDWWKLIL